MPINIYRRYTNAARTRSRPHNNNVMYGSPNGHDVPTEIIYTQILLWNLN